METGHCFESLREAVIRQAHYERNGDSARTKTGLTTGGSHKSPFVLSVSKDGPATGVVRQAHHERK